jgi:hypothetical protein
MKTKFTAYHETPLLDILDPDGTIRDLVKANFIPDPKPITYDDLFTLRKDSPPPEPSQPESLPASCSELQEPFHDLPDE